jgi:soluble lytic murein transglycosylase-like protein
MTMKLAPNPLTAKALSLSPSQGQGAAPSGLDFGLLIRAAMDRRDPGLMAQAVEITMLQSSSRLGSSSPDTHMTPNTALLGNRLIHLPAAAASLALAEQEEDADEPGLAASGLASAGNMTPKTAKSFLSDVLAAYAAPSAKGLAATQAGAQAAPAPPATSAIAGGEYTPPALGSSPQRQEIDRIIQGAAARHGVDPHLVRAVVTAESDFNPRCVSSAGAKGLMQLMPDTAKDLGVSNPFDPAQNIEGGTRYLAQMLKRFDGDEKKALAAYNWGPSNVERSGNLPSETRTYLQRVSRYRGMYASGFSTKA